MGGYQVIQASQVPTPTPSASPCTLAGQCDENLPVLMGSAKKHQPFSNSKPRAIRMVHPKKMTQRQGPAKRVCCQPPNPQVNIGSLVLLIKITDSLSDGCQRPKEMKKAVKHSGNLQPWASDFLSLVLHSLILPFLSLSISTATILRSPASVSPPSINEIHSLNCLGQK